MPPLGQTSDELRLVAWRKAVGDTVAAGEPLLEIETDKATLEVEAAASGTLLQALCQEGETVVAGAVLGWLGEPGESPPLDHEPVPKAAAPASVEQSPAPEPWRAPRAPAAATPRVLATPAARILAREHGIDLAGVAGSGPDGRIERRDVEALIADDGAA
jgi:pyruvate/2-oxoglutarate dehydrogenase complex dihydrolipoamide acyltransferase (E2) component